MKFLPVIIVLAVGFLQLAFGQIQPMPDSQVIKVDDGNFDEIISNAEPGQEWLFFMGAKWCQYCRHFSSEFDILSKKLAETHPHMKLAYSDIDDAPGVSSRFLVAFLPSVYYIKSGHEVRSFDFTNSILRDSKYNKRNSESFINILNDGVWEQMPKWSSYMLPWSILGRTLGMAGSTVATTHKFVRKSLETMPLSGEISMWIIMGVSMVALTVYLFSNGDSMAGIGSDAGAQGKKID